MCMCVHVLAHKQNQPQVNGAPVTLRWLSCWMCCTRVWWIHCTIMHDFVIYTHNNERCFYFGFIEYSEPKKRARKRERGRQRKKCKVKATERFPMGVKMKRKLLFCLFDLVLLAA